MLVAYRPVEPGARVQIPTMVLIVLFLAKKFSLTLLLMTCGWAGSSAWYECLACIQEDAGSNPARSTTKQTRDIFVRGKILNTLWKMKTEGYADSTIKATDRRLLSFTVSCATPQPLSCQSSTRMMLESFLDICAPPMSHGSDHWTKRNSQPSPNQPSRTWGKD